MKLKYLLPIAFIALFFSCSTDNDDDAIVNETEGLELFQLLLTTTKP